MAGKKDRVPKLCAHKGKQLAYVTDPRTGRAVYLGPAGSAESVGRYDVWVKDFVAWREGREKATPPARQKKKKPPLTVAALCLAYLRYAESYYRKHNRPTSEAGTIRQVLSRLNERCGRKRAADFGPLDLKALRDAMAAEKLGREHVNKQLHRVRRAWRWAVSEELIPASCLEALRSVPGLAKGRSAAGEPEKVPPVDTSVVLATLPYLPVRYRSLVLFQLHGAMRPGEAVVLRPCDVDRSVTPWEYRPWTHKTEHHDAERVVYLGPQARAAVGPVLDACRTPEAWAFPSRGRGPWIHVRSHVRVRSYAEAIALAVLAANADGHAVGPPLRPVPHWYPLQLRHTAGTLVRQRYGLEAAQTILGHAEMNTAEIYAEKNVRLAREAAEGVG